MVTVPKNTPVDAYRALHPAYESFAIKLRALLIDILENSQIKYQIVETRAKEVSSFAEKIKRPGKSYKDPINDITDLCGCRIIVYYIDDIDKVAGLIKAEFFLQEENLSRQPDKLEADRFGYLSAHYIVAINEARAGLIEWGAFAKFKAEIQIRTVIQHAWSAVSHTLQYKQETSVPSKLQRRLYRIAGLFELADDEFVALRDLRETQQGEVRKKIHEGTVMVPLSPISIKEFVSTWSGRDELRAACVEAGFSYLDNDQSTFVDTIYKLAVLGGVSDLQGLSKALSIPYKSYLKRLMTENAAAWSVGGEFAIVLVLILFNKDRVTERFLLNNEFSEHIVDVIIIALGKK